LSRIPTCPEEDDGEHYHGLVSEIFMLEGTMLREGICDKVTEFYRVHIAEEARIRLPIPFTSEFHLSL
jgi:hypothetical protein